MADDKPAKKQQRRTLGRLTADRRRRCRRDDDRGDDVIASHWVFDRLERALLRLMERRRQVRRRVDVAALVRRAR